MNQRFFRKESKLALSFVLSLFFVSACAVSPNDPDVIEESEERIEVAGHRDAQLYLVEPLPADQNMEIELLQLTEILYNAELDDEQKANVLLRRAVTFDYLGLKTLSLVDINQAIELKPDLVDAYHSLGIYFSERGEYAGAFEAFDSVIELEPNHDFVYLNRGLASYYNGQFDLAMADFADHYFQDPQDPFRVIWYYFAAKQIDSGRAEEQIREQWPQADGDAWGQKILAYLVNEVSEDELIREAFSGSEDQTELNHRLCEAYFYMGKVAAAQGQNYNALNFFKLSLSTNVYAYLEHRYARSEIARLRESIRTEQE
ncbi:lipoprotein NlpI [Aliidiomarina iranensis]|uniref:Lipoprotein NlpI n=1 Tax=Aliidiomarina iranensis TaxID=1434071 RepID=A0A432VWZ2_9GAMM|nr:lipoprotein NlpI [Aliidiomarina iranensis]RUO21192.1 lipoprotein NlpI [Aliidiomarina iranensis]